MARNIKYIVFHCSASGHGNEGVKEITACHLAGYNFWTKDGYHYLVTRDGKVYPLVPESESSNGVKNFSNFGGGSNSTSINICYTGGGKNGVKHVVSNGKNGSANNKNVTLTGDSRTEAQKKSLRQLAAEMKAKYPNAKFIGHYQVSPDGKTCPCFNAEAEYNNITPASSINNYGTPLNYTRKGNDILQNGKKVGVLKTTIDKDGKKLGSIIWDPNATPSSGSIPNYDSNLGSCAEAVEEQVQQYKLAVEAIGKTLTEYPDTVIDTINSVYDTYKTVVETVKSAQIKIPIPEIPNPLEIPRKTLTGFKQATQQFLEDADNVLSDTVTVLASDYDLDEILEGESEEIDGTNAVNSQDTENNKTSESNSTETDNQTSNNKKEFKSDAFIEYLKNHKNPIIRACADLITPGFNFIGNADEIINAVNMNINKSVSGIVNDTFTIGDLIIKSDDLVPEILNPDSEILKILDTANAKEKSNSLISGINDAVNAVNSGMDATNTAINSATSIVDNTMNAGMEALSGVYDLANGSINAVGEILQKIPGIMPKIISEVLKQYVFGTINDLANAATDAIDSATGAVNDTINGATGAVNDAIAGTTVESNSNNDVNQASLNLLDSEESEPGIYNENIISDSVNNIYQDKIKLIIGENDESEIELFENTIKASSNSLIPNSELNSDNQTTNNQTSNFEQTSNSSVDDILNSLNEAQKQAEASVAAAIAEVSASSDNPHIDSTETELLIEQTASNNQKINELESEFKQTFSEVAQLKLYTEVRKSFLEILPEIKPGEDMTNKNFVNMATFATLKMTPAIIEYLDAKFEILEEKINNLITQKLSQQSSSNSTTE